MRRDVQEIFRNTPHGKQVMMFSATLSKEIRPVCKKFMQDVNTTTITSSTSTSSSTTSTSHAKRTAESDAFVDGSSWSECHHQLVSTLSMESGAGDPDWLPNSWNPIILSSPAKSLPHHWPIEAT